MGQNQPQSKRQHYRLTLFIPVHIHLEGNATPLKAEAEDLSLGGAFIRSTTPIPVGAKLHMEFLLSTMKSSKGRIIEVDRIDPGASPRIVVLAEVRWKDPRGIGFGVQFLRIPEKNVKLVKNIIAFMQNGDDE